MVQQSGADPPAGRRAARIHREKENIMLTRNKHDGRLPAVRGLVAASLLALAPVIATMPVHAGDTQVSADAAEWQQVQKQSAQALEAMKNYSASQRAEALTKGKQLLDAMDDRIDRLEARSQNEWGQLSRQAREQRRDALRALRKQRDDLAQWYGGLRHGSTGAWDEVKQGFVDAYGTLSRSFGDAMTQFSADASSKKKQP